MKTLKANHPRIWCLITFPILTTVYVLAAFYEYTCHFFSNLKRIWFNLWDDLRTMFSDPYHEIRRELKAYEPWSEIAKVWNKASK